MAKKLQKSKKGMSPRAKSVLVNSFKGIISNQSCVDNGKEAPWWLAILFLLFSVLIPLIPNHVHMNNAYGSSFLTSGAFGLDTGLAKATVQLRADDKGFDFVEGLLTYEEVHGIDWGDKDPTKIDYATLFKYRFDILYKAYQRFKPMNDFYLFINMNKDWVEDYALFMALKKHFNYKPWTEWPEGLKLHKESELKSYRLKLQYEIRLYLFIEYKFQQQLKKLRDHAFFKRVTLIGEIPFYPPLDSADVWANQDLFQIDKNGNLLAKAGAPPDSFNSEVQIWGNPLYN